MVESQCIAVVRCICCTPKWHGRKVATWQVVCLVSIFGHECAIEYFAIVLVLAYCGGIFQSSSGGSDCFVESIIVIVITRERKWRV